MENEQKELQLEQFEEARRMKRRQDSIKSKYEFLKGVSTKNFQAEYIKAQAEEICRYIKEIELTPFNPWYSELYKVVSTGEFMSKYYITFNKYGVIEPDYEKIKTLILPDPGPEDFPRGTIRIA